MKKSKKMLLAIVIPCIRTEVGTKSLLTTKSTILTIKSIILTILVLVHIINRTEIHTIKTITVIILEDVIHTLSRLFRAIPHKKNSIQIHIMVMGKSLIMKF